MRGRLLAQLRRITEPIDTPRGVTIIVADSEFAGGALSAGALVTMEKVAQILAPTSLKVTVGGYSDNASGETQSRDRAEAVRDALVTGGLKPNAVAAYGFGRIRPTTSNATEAGRSANRRVEIVIAGGEIGDSPLWDHSYSLTSR
jgi:outer membrane protein OmpA-like peptidoglycan-associated protein